MKSLERCLLELDANHKWDEIYASLQPYNVTVAGGRVHGVGKYFYIWIVQ